MTKNFDIYFEKQGIRRKLTVPRTTEQSEIAEQKTNYQQKWHDVCCYTQN